jgi:hypothetical protein
MDNLRILGDLTGVQIAAAFGHSGKKGLELFKGDIEAFKKKLGEVSASINKDLGGILTQAQGMGFRLPPTLTPYLDKLREMKILSEDNIALLGQFGDDSVVDFKKMEEAAARYDISLDALGTGFNQTSINEAAAQILEDYDLLKRGGADVGAVLTGCPTRCRSSRSGRCGSGFRCPENMREIAAQLIANGELIDENGEKITDINTLIRGPDQDRPRTDRPAARAAAHGAGHQAAERDREHPRQHRDRRQLSRERPAELRRARPRQRRRRFRADV